MRQAVTAHYEGLVEDLRDDGLEPPVTLDEYLTAATAGGIGPNVFGELVVRTADGTWRQSYRSFCTQWIISVWGPGTDELGVVSLGPDPLVPGLGLLRPPYLPTEPPRVLPRPPRIGRRLGPGFDLRPGRDGSQPPGRRILGGAPDVSTRERKTLLVSAELFGFPS